MCFCVSVCVCVGGGGGGGGGGVECGADTMTTEVVNMHTRVQNNKLQKNNNNK